MKYRISNIPTPVTDSVIRAIALDRKIVLTGGLKIGPNYFEMETPVPIANVVAFQKAIQVAFSNCIGTVEIIA